MIAAAERTRTIADLIGRHRGADVFVVGTGTSLAAFEWGQLVGGITVALNDAMLARGFVPTYHLFVDDALAERYAGRWDSRTTVCLPNIVRHLARSHAGAVAGWTQVQRDLDMSRLPWSWPSVAVGVDTDELYCVHTIAIAGIQLAWKLGARRIILLGLDGYTSKTAAYFDGRRDGTPHAERGARDVGDGRIVTMKHIIWRYEHEKLREWFAEIGFLRSGAGVYNANPRSTLDAWPKINLTLQRS